MTEKSTAAREYTRVYRLIEIAAVLGFHRDTIERAINAGDLSAVKIGSQWTCTRSDLVAWLGEGRFEELFRGRAT